MGQTQHEYKPETLGWLCLHTDEGRRQLWPWDMQKEGMLAGTSLFSAVLYFYCGIWTVVTSRKKLRTGKQLKCKEGNTSKPSFGFLVLTSLRKVPVASTLLWWWGIRLVLGVLVRLFSFKQQKGETGLGHEQFEIIYSVAQEKNAEAIWKEFLMSPLRTMENKSSLFAFLCLIYFFFLINLKV